VTAHNLAITVAVFVLVATNTWADEKALSIVRENDERDSGYVDLRVDVEMHLTDRHGQNATRQLEIRQLEIPNDGDQSLLIMRTPLAVRGTALLSHAYRDRDDDQWIYLPAVSRVKKIASRNKSGPFLGSTFAYEDLLSQEIEKFDYRLLREDEFGGRQHWVIERVPRDKHSGYSKQEAWYDQKRFTVTRIVYFDKQGVLLKTLETDDWQYLYDRFWKPHSMIMENHQTGKTTSLVWSSYQLLTNDYVSNRDFSISALRRAR